MNDTSEQQMHYRVRFYDPKLSRKGQGSRVATFNNLSEAESFAVGKIYHAKPATVEQVIS